MLFSDQVSLDSLRKDLSVLILVVMDAVLWLGLRRDRKPTNIES